MSTHTYNDVIQEINDIDSEKQELNTLIATTFGVNTVTADSSLADLSTNIGLINTDQHPDYELPWIMADGSSGFVVPFTLARDRAALTNVAVVPHPDNHGTIVRAAHSSGADWGLNQMTTSMRARYSMDASPGNARDANNYAGQSNSWGDSSCPYWHKMTFIISHYNTQFRVSLKQNDSWVHGNSSMAQASTSGYNSYPVGVFGCPYVENTKVYMRPNETNKYFASKGTIMYEIMFGSGAYTGISYSDYYKPVLHWDSVYNKYRPCLKSQWDNIPKYSSFGIGEGDNFPDDGRDGAYYIDTAAGIEYIGRTIPVSTTDYSNILIDTDIPYNRSNQIIISWSIGIAPDNRPLLTVNGPSPQNLISVERDTTFNISVYDLGGSATTIYSSSTRPTDYIGYDYSGNNKCWTSSWNGSYLRKAFGTTTPGTSSTEGYTYTINARCVDYVYIVDSNNKVTNYLATCTYNGNTVLYDVITKTIYQ